jgi:hypothetical protein
MKNLHRKTTLIIVFVLLPVICTGVCFWILADYRAAVKSAEENWVITDLAQYPKIRNGSEWDHQKLTGHFPEQIPSQATDIHLMYSPPYLQKGANFQLRFKLPPSEIEQLLLKYDELAQQTYEGHEGASDYMTKSYLPLPPCHINDDPAGSILPKDYVIIVLGSEPRGQDDFLWNHGYTYGVAINKSISEILYWAEHW